MSELSQISIKFDNFRHTDSKDDRIVYGTLNVYFT